MQSAIHYPSIKNLLLKCVPKHYMDIHAEHEAFTHERVSKRVELGKQRDDLIEGLLMKQDELVSLPPATRLANIMPCHQTQSRRLN